MKSLYESLLDDEEEVMKRTGINIFKDMFSAKTKKDFYKHVDMLFDSCIKINTKEEMQQYKKSFFVTELFGFISGTPIGIVVDKAMYKTKKSIISKIYDGMNGGVKLLMSSVGKIHFGQGHRVAGYIQHEDIYVMPKYIEDQYIEYIKNHTKDIFIENNRYVPVKNTIDKIL